MINKILIKTDQKELFQGNKMDIPIRENIIVKKCIQLFADEDPCIIHRAFAIKKILLNAIEIINSLENSTISAKNLGCDFIDSVDIKDINNAIIYIEKG